MERSRLAAVAAAALVLATTSPTAAFQFETDPVQNQRPVSACPLNDGAAFYRFTPDSDPAAIPYAREGFEQWNHLQDIYNFSLTSVTEVPAGSTNVSPYTVAVTVKDYGQYVTSEVHNCNLMAINTHFGVNAVRANAAHEMGHVLGLHHTGRHDSFIGDVTDPYPAMTTCIDSWETLKLRVRTDDRAAVEFFHGPPRFDRFSDEYRPVTSNPGFENGLLDWSARSGSTLTLGYVGGAGIKSLLLRSTTGPATAFQRTNVAPDASADRAQMIASARLRKHVATDTGTAGIYLYERVVEYGEFDPNANEFLECTASEYPIFRNANVRVSVGPLRLLGYGSCVPTTTWTPCQTESGYTYASATSLDDASDLTIEIHSNMKNSAGAWYGVEVDNAEVGYFNTAVSPL